MIYDFACYRTFLKASLTERIHRNPSYSLRSMASSLKIAAPQLSDIFKGKKNLSAQSGLKVAAKLGLDIREQEYFSLLIQYETTKSPSVKRIILEKINSMNSTRRYAPIDTDVLKVASEWYHIPILVMCELPQFDGNPKIIAKRLGISQIEAETAVERLIRLGLIMREPSNFLRPVLKKALFQSEEANTGLKLFHKQMLSKAITALESQSNIEKAVGSETFMFDPKDLKKIELLLEDFFNSASKVAEKGKNKLEVYHLGAQFFRLTNLDKKI